ncbi:hypothetical protein XELAEV_18032796mg [Xenopus laevis]|uniref:Uncharacterized protein n=1 Tax=Xenopus laevis TaxID=8355 RepID=A0A974HDF0_XENLA|nr:hypothetical protein XELAEV_18032796mg [Xenopus laevis]
MIMHMPHPFTVCRILDTNWPFRTVTARSCTSPDWLRHHVLMHWALRLCPITTKSHAYYSKPFISMLPPRILCSCPEYSFIN